jgi:ubiquinone/menaquinone biosynthesis C-methylase UbiE
VPGEAAERGADQSLREAWDEEAADWIRFARGPDVFAWRFNIPAFLGLLPPPGRLTIDIGCGEGRVARELMSRGHVVKGIDGSPAMVEAARQGEPSVDATVADAASLPLDDATADLAVSFMTLQSVDDLETSIGEAARVLVPGGHLCVSVHRPLASYFGALEAAGLAVEAAREPIPGPDLLSVLPRAERWTRTPCFLHFRARKHG